MPVLRLRDCKESRELAEKIIKRSDIPQVGVSFDDSGNLMLVANPMLCIPVDLLGPKPWEKVKALGMYRDEVKKGYFRGLFYILSEKPKMARFTVRIPWEDYEKMQKKRGNMGISEYICDLLRK